MDRGDSDEPIEPVENPPEDTNVPDRMDPFRERFVRSFLDWVILSIVQRKPSYGYEMITIIAGEFRVYVSPGSLYPILYELEQSGLIAGAWDLPDRKSRKIYRLTPEGDRGLREGLEVIDAILSALRHEDGKESSPETPPQEIT